MDFHPSVSSFNVPQQDYLASHPNRQYDHIATGCLVFHRQHDSKPRILLLQRAASDSMPGKWEVPGGACDDSDHSILHAAARELWEEAGIKAVLIGPEVGDGHVFTTSSGKKVCKFNFFVEIEGTNASALPPPVKLDPNEHQQYVWASREEVRSHRAASFQLDFTKQAQEDVILQGFMYVDNS
jgi:8-oxo-dGTP pyrophosphatase MutT (NUDIX family)